MAKQLISISDLIYGQPLPWDIFDAHGSLLVRKGNIIDQAQQVEHLANRELYIEVAAPANTAPVAKPSTLRMLNAANKRLHMLLNSISKEPDARAKLLEVAKIIMLATDMSSEVALGCIIHNQSHIYSVRHSIDTAVVSLLIARSINKSPEELLMITVAALTMNVGMLIEQEHYQSKKDVLSQEEKNRIRQHPQISVDLLTQAGVTDEDWLSYVLMHHENENGTGYPNQRLAKDIPQGAKIISLADRYCARVSGRNYRKSLLPNAALRNFLLEAKDTIDRTLVTFFIRELGTYPIGTYVRLENGDVGIVVAKGQSTTTPIVLSLIGPRGAPLTTLYRRDTSKEMYSIREVLEADKAAAEFTLEQIWGEFAAL